jgi:hypothetical protein
MSGRVRSIAATIALGIVPGVMAAQSTTVKFLDYEATVPAGWTTRAPSSNMRLAEYVLPTTSAGSGEVVVFFFGKAQGGNVAANLARWKGQFSTADGSPVQELVTRDSTGRFPLTFAEYQGNYRRGIGAGSADSVRAGQTLVASVVETPNGTLFIQLFGNSARVAAERDTFVRFVKGLK